MARRYLHCVVAVPRLNRDANALPETRTRLGQAVLRNAEQDRDGLKLRNDQYPGSIRGMNHISWIDQTQTGNARDGRRDLRVNQLEFCVLDVGLIGSYAAFELRNYAGRPVDLRFGNRVLRQQLFIAFELGARVLKGRLVARQLPLSLSKLDLIRLGVDRGQHLTGLNETPFSEAH